MANGEPTSAILLQAKSNFDPDNSDSDEEDESDDDCTQAQTDAEAARCKALCAGFQAQLNALKTQFDLLSKQTFAHNIAVSGYDQTSLPNFTAQVTAFSSAINTYAQQLVGRTYSTTALDAQADALQAQIPALQASFATLTGTYNQLQSDFTTETASQTTLQTALQSLSKAIGAALKAGFRCNVKCPCLSPLQAQTDNLLARCHFTIKQPSGPPPNVPTVPRLPDPPLPPTPGSPGPPNAIHAPRTKITIAPPMPALARIDAGYVWPFVIPPEGSPRMCVQVTYEWLPTNPTLGFRPKGAGILFQHDFGPTPTITIGGGLTATDIVLSDDHTRLYFTLTPPPSGAKPGQYPVVIVDGTVTINLASNDPKTSITVDTDDMNGLASLVMSTLIAIDAGFDVLPAASPTFTAFLNAMSNPLAALQLAFTAFADRLRAATPLTPEQFGVPLDLAAVAGPHYPPGGTSDPTLGAYFFFGFATWSFALTLGAPLAYWMGYEIYYGSGLIGLPLSVATTAQAQLLLQLQWNLAVLPAGLLPGGPTT